MTSTKKTRHIRLVIGFFLMYLPCFSLHCVFGKEIPPDTPPEVRQAIKGLLSHEAVTRIRSASRLATFGPRAIPAIPFLIELLNDSEKAHNQSGSPPTSPAKAATDTLIRIGNPAVIPLIASMKHDNWMIRARSAEIRGYIKNHPAVQSLTKGMTDKNSIVRKLAAESAGGIEQDNRKD
jgi:HEAT repeat protein